MPAKSPPASSDFVEFARLPGISNSSRQAPLFAWLGKAMRHARRSLDEGGGIARQNLQAYNR